MLRWLRAASESLAVVSDDPGRWLPGALAWTVSAGWIALVAGVARPPTTADLTFFGARFYTSGAWPWNLVGLIVALVALLALAVVLAAVGEAVLVRGTRAAGADVRRIATISAVCGLPLLLALGMLALGAAAVAETEFNSPYGEGSPLMRIGLRLAPLLIGTVVITLACRAWHAAAVRDVLAGVPVRRALGQAPRRLARRAGAALTQSVAGLVARIGSIVFAAVLLRVLWAPIESRLAHREIGVALVLLLVGFVAIWLCGVLAGGALHAWGSLTWTRILGEPEERVAATAERRTGA